MQMLSEDDLNIRSMTREELDLAWDFWFDLAQSTNDADPAYTHGVFAGPERPASRASLSREDDRHPRRPTSIA